MIEPLTQEDMDEINNELDELIDMIRILSWLKCLKDMLKLEITYEWNN